MRNHVHQYLRVIDFIEENKPKLVVELGVFGGACTVQLIGLVEPYKFHLISVDDNMTQIYNKLPLDIADKIIGIQDISYKFLKRFPNIEGLPEQFKKKIDLCIIDTDHNYWTLRKELKELKLHLSDNAIIVFHDTEEFKDWSGYMTQGYGVGEYPKEEIMKVIDIPMVKAIDEFLDENKDFEVVREVVEAAGAMAIQRVR